MSPATTRRSLHLCVPNLSTCGSRLRTLRNSWLKTQVSPYVSAQTSHLGFSCTWPSDAHALQPAARTVLLLLHALNGTARTLSLVDRANLADGLGVLLQGQAGKTAPLSGPSLSLLFRLIRHTRRLNRLEAGSFS